jgi:hypothetical protein
MKKFRNCRGMCLSQSDYLPAAKRCTGAGVAPCATILLPRHCAPLSYHPLCSRSTTTNSRSELWQTNEHPFDPCSHTLYLSFRHCIRLRIGPPKMTWQHGIVAPSFSRVLALSSCLTQKRHPKALVVPQQWESTQPRKTHLS